MRSKDELKTYLAEIIFGGMPTTGASKELFNFFEKQLSSPKLLKGWYQDEGTKCYETNPSLFPSQMQYQALLQLLNAEQIEFIGRLLKTKKIDSGLIPLLVFGGLSQEKKKLMLDTLQVTHFNLDSWKNLPLGVSKLNTFEKNIFSYFKTEDGINVCKQLSAKKELYPLVTIFLALQNLKVYNSVYQKNPIGAFTYSKVNLLSSKPEKNSVKPNEIYLLQQNNTLSAWWIYDNEVITKSLPINHFEFDESFRKNPPLDIITKKFGCDLARSAKNKIHLLNHELQKQLRENNQLDNFMDYKEFFVAQEIITQDENALLAPLQRPHLFNQKHINLPKPIYGEIAQKLAKSKNFDVINNFSLAFFPAFPGVSEVIDKFGLPFTISRGYEHTIYLTERGEVFVVGANHYGQLGLGHTDHVLTPTQLPITDVKEVICGPTRTLFIKNDGTILVCGANYYGQLGLGHTNKVLTPIPLPIDDVKKVICEDWQTLFIKKNGEIWVCGHNEYGQLGLGHTDQVLTPTQLPIDDVKNVICGCRYTLFIKNNGAIWGSGSHFSEQLGLAELVFDYLKILTPIPLPIVDVENVICGQRHTLFIKNDATILVCGDNDCGQLGLADTNCALTPIQLPIDDVENVICGGHHNVFIKKNGEIWGCGDNKYGQLGLGHTDDVLTPTKLPITDVKEVICGPSYTLFIKQNNEIFGCGENFYNQLLPNNHDKITTPTKISIDFLENQDKKEDHNNLSL